MTSGSVFPKSSSINPFGKDDWEGVGVHPDVDVKAADALETTVKLVATRAEKSGSENENYVIGWANFRNES